MRRITRIESALGGANFYDEDGNLIGYSLPGIFGGEDYFWDNGESGYTVDNIIGNGEDYVGSDGTRAYSIDSIFGGKTIHGDVSGYCIDSPFYGNDIVIYGND